MIRPLIIATALILASPVAFAQHADRYGTSEALRVQQVRPATVLMVRTVKIENDKMLNKGSAIGTAIGYGVARSANIDSDHRSAVRAITSVVGGVAGTSAGRALSRREAVEIYVRDEDRRKTYAIVQEMEQIPQRGDLVFLTGSGSKTRIVAVR